MAEPVLDYQEVVKEYTSSHLGRVTRSRGLEGFTLTLRKGEIFGLLGLNGSGKTTAFKLALGLLRPTEGEVRVAGHAPGTLDALAEVGYLPELPYFYPYLTPRESLDFYGRLSQMPAAELHARREEVLEKVGLRDAAGREAKGFSKGMLQRLGLAQAILHRPNIIILDEPVSGLDPLAIHDIRILLKELNDDGRTLLMSSHSISNVENLCHRVGILVEGRLVRTIEQAEWAGQPGSLERIFVDTVRPRREVKR
ncbi:MAG: ABC transporter ATP-binding protein [Elusimicrobiota bacterium]